MILSTRAIELLDQEARLKLAIALGFTEYWVNKSIKKNKPNGPLTTAMALKVMREETGLSDDQILEDEVVGAQK